MLYSGYSVLGVCCTRGMLYSGYAVLGACCTLVMLYFVYAVLGVCSTWCMLYLVYTALRVRSNWCMRHSVYAEPSIQSRARHGLIERNNLTLCYAILIELWTRKQGGEWRWEPDAGYEWMWTVRDRTCPNRFWRLQIGGHTCQMVGHACTIGGHHYQITIGMVTCTWNSVLLQFLSKTLPISSHLPPACSQLYHHLRCWSLVIPLSLSQSAVCGLILSAANA